MKNKLLALAALSTLLLAGAAEADAQAVPDHALFSELLREIVVAPLVDYERLQERRGLLDRYIATLSDTSPADLAASSREERLAFWINAYNACMLLRVTDHYPIEKGGAGLAASLRNLAAGRPSNSVWQIPDVFSEPFCPVAGQPRSLDEIEHGIIRPDFGEPRIHFAVNCAAFSCPVLAEEAYTGDRLDEQLDRQVRRLIEDSRHFRIESGRRPTLHLNKVLEWYAEDFGGSSALPGFFARYLEGAERETLLDPRIRVRFFDYDWTLNDVHAGREG